jgi:uncharacterized protein YqjF (DUF2071 family)
MKPLLTAYWNNLVMLNFEIDVAALQPYLPAYTEIDLYNNKCLISLVAFQFSNAKFLKLPIPFYRNFPQINLRFYVKRQFKNEIRKGVVFIKEIAEGKLLKAGAALLYNEHYFNLPTRQSFENSNNYLNANYEWNFKNEWNGIHSIANKEKSAPTVNSIEAFITDRYWGYTKISKNKTAEFKVEHPVWNIHTLKSFEFQCNSKEIYGEQLHAALLKKPLCAFMVDGSFVKVHNKTLCTN